MEERVETARTKEKEGNEPQLNNQKGQSWDRNDYIFLMVQSQEVTLVALLLN